MKASLLGTYNQLDSSEERRKYYNNLTFDEQEVFHTELRDSIEKRASEVIRKVREKEELTERDRNLHESIKYFNRWSKSKNNAKRYAESTVRFALGVQRILDN